VVAEDNLVVGYYSLTVGQVDKIAVPDRIGKGMGNYPVPVVILARLAVRTDYQGRSIGSGMLKDAMRRTLVISAEVGVRAILTHPVDDNACVFYKKYGFESSPLREKQLLLLLKDARKIIMN
jgi:GNAT superfamily N-acetyltransferase